MRISPISVNVLPKTAKKVVSNPVKAIGLAAVASGIATGILSDKEQPKTELVKNEDIKKIPQTLLVTKEDIKNKLITMGYREENGVLLKDSDKEENKTLRNKYGIFDAGHFKNALHKPVADEDLFEIQTFIEIGKEKGKKLFDNNFDSLFTTYSVLKQNKSLYEFMVRCNQNPDMFKLVENLANTSLSKEVYKSISKYKGKAYVGLGQKMQEDLRAQAANDKYKIGGRVQKCIDNISGYIDKQTVPASVKLYRGEGCHTSLTKVKTANGEVVNFGHMMFQASNWDNQDKILKVKEFIQDNELTLEMPAFMSTSLDENVADDFSCQYSEKDKVLWEFDVKRGTKGAFVEGLYANAYFENQNEVLLQKGSKIVIKEADYDKDRELWIIKAEVSN